MWFTVAQTGTKMMTTWEAIGVILLYASVKIQGINIPQEWKELLSSVCKEKFFAPYLKFFCIL